jgi:hypothetical protein
MKKTVAVFIWLLFAIQCQAKIITVDDNGPADFNNIQAAINDSNDGDVIEVQPGTYTGDVNRDIDFLGKAITLRSANGSQNCIIDCDGSETEYHRGFYFHNSEDSNSVLDGFTITNGYADVGGGICCEGSSPTITNCTIKNNRTRDGQYQGCGLHADGGNGGGIYCSYSSAIITNCDIVNNRTGDGDAYCSCEGPGDCWGEDGGNGGGIYCLFSSLKIKDCIIAGNTTGTGGWGFYMGSGDGGQGAGICCSSSTLMIEDCLITNNRTGNGQDSHIEVAGNGGDGAGICCLSSPASITNCIIAENGTGKGGDSDDFGHGRGGDGAGVYSFSSPLTITNCIVNDNTTGNGGHAKYWGGIGGRGAGICAWSPLTCCNCIISGNTTGHGGDSSTERAGNGGDGAGIYSRKENSIIINCTVVGNKTGIGGFPNGTDGSAGGIWSYTSIPVTNCILWNNVHSGRIDEYAQINLTPIVNYCCIQGWTGYLGGTGNMGADPCFIDSGYWDANSTVDDPNDDFWIAGDYHLCWTSPCIDAGDPYFVSQPDETDIDGEPRIIVSRVDIGSDEVGPKQADFTRDGIINLEDFRILARGWFSQVSQQNWYVLCDLYEDGYIEFKDLSVLIDDWLWEAYWHE